MNKIQESAAYIASKLGETPRVGIVLGSGLGGLAEAVEQPVAIEYREIPHFAVSTAPDHKGRFVAGRLAGKPVLCMQGRLHFYEGHGLTDVVHPVRVMKALGVQTLILTNAAGGVNPEFSVGDLMLLEDHINFMGNNPLIGKNDDELGPRFCDMTYAYDRQLRELAQQAARQENVELKRGVYLACTGPSFETPAEIRAFRILGADAVGMSTVPEVIAANHCGLRVLAFSLITNMAAGMLDQPLSGEEVIAIGARKGAELCRLVTAVLEKMEGAEWDF